MKWGAWSQLELDGVLLLGVLGGGGAGAALVLLLLELSLVVAGADVVLLSLFVSVTPFLFDPPEYRSEYHPEPFKMKLAELINRLAASA